MNLNYFNRAGWPFMLGASAVTFLMHYGRADLFFVSLVVTAWCFYFFRDPCRATPVRPGLIVSPADGRVVAVREVAPEESLGIGTEPRIRISVFLNVFNVHVNRMPADGLVTAKNYRPGKFFNASLDKASADNERMAIAIQLTGDHPYENKPLGVVQIAGLVARRIVCSAEAGNAVKAGERYGIIRFGSRADIYLPPGLAPLVSVGQTMVGGETVLADCASPETMRHSEVRK